MYAVTTPVLSEVPILAMINSETPGTHSSFNWVFDVERRPEVAPQFMAGLVTNRDALRLRPEYRIAVGYTKCFIKRSTWN
jgi:hypothetical protein